MVVLKFILLVLALFITLLWITKLVTDCVSAMYGNNFTEENAQKDGIIRLYMITAMSILWALIILLQ